MLRLNEESFAAEQTILKWSLQVLLSVLAGAITQVRQVGENSGVTFRKAESGKQLQGKHTEMGK